MDRTESTSPGRRRAAVIVAAAFLAAAPFVFAAVSSSSSAQTAGYGSPRTVIWDRDRTLDATFQVGDEDILIITPGVTVYVAPNAAILVNGKLTIEGEADRPVLLTSNGSAGPWYGIIINSTAVRSSLSFATVEQARVGLDVFGSAEVYNATVRSCQDAGVVVRPGASLSWDGGSVSQNPKQGFNLNGTASIRNATVDGNVNGIVVLGKDPAISNCTIGGNQWGVSVFAGSPTISGCFMSDNTRQAVTASGRSASSRIVENTLTGSGESGIFLTNGSSADVLHNNISNNSGRGAPKTVAGIYAGAQSVLRAEGNVLDGNDVGIWLESAGDCGLYGNTVSSSVRSGVHCYDTYMRAEDNTLQSNGGNGIEMAGERSKAVLDNNAITGSGRNGTYLADGQVISFSGNTVSGSHDYPVVLYDISSGAVDQSANTFQGNGKNRVKVISGKGDGDASFADRMADPVFMGAAAGLAVVAVIIVYLVLMRRRLVADESSGRPSKGGLGRTRAAQGSRPGGAKGFNGR